ncbi:hypothetical protein VNO78_10826 [Psophocarpus tetragonolobus]|uniref:Uncharacterized protein n=1 Tax=Psophocarpus tetragonolobus TaxID=3891 RepID=A0AAN9XN35_PSOTE
MIRGKTGRFDGVKGVQRWRGRWGAIMEGEKEGEEERRRREGEGRRKDMVYEKKREIGMEVKEKWVRRLFCMYELKADDSDARQTIFTDEKVVNL